MTGPERSEARMREVCRTLLAELELAPPLTPEGLCAALAARRRRRIVLKAARLGSTTSVGHLVVRRNSDLILYEAGAPRAQQAHVVFHEVIHLVRGHLGDPGAEGHAGLTCGALPPGEPVGPEDVPAPGRTANLYSAVQEWEAETGATILTEGFYLRGRPTQLGPGEGGAERGLAGAFGLTTGGRP